MASLVLAVIETRPRHLLDDVISKIRPYLKRSTQVAEQQIANSKWGQRRMGYTATQRLGEWTEWTWWTEWTANRSLGASFLICVNLCPSAVRFSFRGYSFRAKWWAVMSIL